MLLLLFQRRRSVVAQRARLAISDGAMWVLAVADAPAFVITVSDRAVAAVAVGDAL